MGNFVALLRLIVLGGLLLDCKSRPASSHRSPPMTDQAPAISEKQDQVKADSEHEANCNDPAAREAIRKQFRLVISAEQQRSACDVLKVSKEPLTNDVLGKRGDVPPTIDVSVLPGGDLVPAPGTGSNAPGMGSNSSDVAPPDTSESGSDSFDPSVLIAGTSVLVVATAIVGVLAIYAAFGTSHGPGVDVKGAAQEFAALKAEYTDLFGDKVLPEEVVRQRAVDYRKSLETLWNRVYDIKSPAAWAAQAEIINEIDRLVEKTKHWKVPIEPLDFDRYPTFMTTNPPVKSYIPLVDMVNIGVATDVIREFGGEPFTPEEFEAALKKRGVTMLKETSAAGAMIEKIYGANKAGLLYRIGTSAAVLQFVTGYMGLKTSRSIAGNELSAIAGFSSDLGINPWEVVVGPDGKRTIRGTRFLFGRDFTEYKTLSQWFVRDLTSEALDLYAEGFRQREGQLRGVLGEGHQRLMMASADARFRFATFPAGEGFDPPQRIVGKILRPEDVSAARPAAETLYPTEEYSFRIKDLLRVGTEYDPSRHLAESDPNFAMQKQREMHALFYDEMRARGVHQSVWRLAPADVHKFGVPADGHPMTNREVVEYLQEQARFRGEADGTKLTELLKYFQGQEADQARVNAAEAKGERVPNRGMMVGTSYSVDTRAVANNPKLLATNSCIPMFYRTADGKVISLFYIGATGVEGVAVNPSTRSFAAGETNGYMATGENVGEFNPRASTIIMYTFSDEFDFTREIEEYRKATQDLERVPELRARRGSLLMVKKAKHLFMEYLAHHEKYGAITDPIAAIEQYLEETGKSAEPEDLERRALAEKAKGELLADRSAPDRGNDARNQQAWDGYKADGVLRKAFEVEKTAWNPEIHTRLRSAYEAKKMKPPPEAELKRKWEMLKRRAAGAHVTFAKSAPPRPRTAAGHGGAKAVPASVLQMIVPGLLLKVIP